MFGPTSLSWLHMPPMPPHTPRIRTVVALVLVAAVLWTATTTGFGHWTRERVVPLVESMSDATNQEAHDVHNLVRKALHLPAYAVLAFTLAWAALGRRGWLGVAGGLTIVVAFADELVQSATPGRQGSIRDVALDAGGALLGLGLAAWLLPRRASKGASS